MSDMVDQLRFVEMFRQLVFEIESEHGEAGLKVLTPATRERRLSAVWFVDGHNHGIRLALAPDGTGGPRVEAWGQSGSVGFMTLVPASGKDGRRCLERWHLGMVAASVGLLPMDRVARPAA